MHNHMFFKYSMNLMISNLSDFFRFGRFLVVLECVISRDF